MFGTICKHYLEETKIELNGKFITTRSLSFDLNDLWYRGINNQRKLCFIYITEKILKL